jgi:PAS domain S-box-containing protein
MRSYLPARQLPKMAKKISLRWVLIVPFVLQTVGAIGLTGYVAFRNGQEAVSHLAEQLMGEVGDRVSQTLTNYLETPRLVSQLNLDAIARGDLKLDLDRYDPQREEYFGQQLRQFSNLSWISLGSAQNGSYAGAYRDPSGLQRVVANQSTQSQVVFYASDAQGHCIAPVQPVKIEARRYDSHQRPWYRAAARADKLIWTDIYPGYASGSLFISASQPIYDPSGKLLGVSSADLSLRNLQNFLAQTHVSHSGQVFIIERSGTLVASSSQESVFGAGQQVRRRAIDSQVPAIRAAARYIQQLKSAHQIIKRSNLRFHDAEQQYFATVLPLSVSEPDQPDPRSPALSYPDWMIVVVMPEANFMAEINDNLHQTLLLCLAALFFATGSGILTAQWVTAPLLRLQRAAQEVALGEFDHLVEIHRSDEVGKLGRSFNQMKIQLKTFFTAFEQSEQKIAQLLESLPIGVATLNGNGDLTYLNPTGQEIFPRGTRVDASSKDFSEIYQLYQVGTESLYLFEQLPGVRALRGEFVANQLMEVRRQGEVMLLEVKAAPVFDPVGNVSYAIMVFQDISERRRAEAAIQRSEEQLRLTMEFGQIASWIWQFTTGENVWNDQTFTVLGYELGSVKPHYERWRDRVHPEDLPQVERTIKAALESHVDCHAEYRILWPDGSLHWLLGQGRGIYDEAGEALQMVGILIDITDRKSAETALLESEARFRRLAENVPGVIYRYILHADGTDQFTYMSPRCSEIYEIEADRVMQDSSLLWRLIHPEDAIALQSLAPIASQTLQPWAFDYRITTPSGKNKWIQNFAAPDSQPDGSVYWDGVVTDISDRKQSELLLSNYNRTLEERVKERTEALQRSEASYRSILEDQTEFIVRLDADGMITYANEVYCRRFGLDHESLKPLHYAPAVHDIDRAYVTERFAAISPENPVMTIENRGTTVLGDRWAQWINRGFFDQYGNLIAVQSVGRDIHDRKQAEAELRQAKEAAEAANKAKSIFLANMSHELRTPLNVIIGFSQLMTQDSLTLQQQNQLQIINRNGEYLLQLINDVLSIAKIEAGRTSLQENSLDLYALLQDVEEMFSLRAKLKGIQLSCDCNGNVPQFIQTDERKLRQVLTNLLDNAIKFTDQGFIRLQVRWLEVCQLRADELQTDELQGNQRVGDRHNILSDDPPNTLASNSEETLLFTVEDTGSGIALNEIDGLFDPFVQAQAGISSKQGTGLGLTLCRHFLNLMGGEIFVNSCLGKGTTFQFTLPCISSVVVSNPSLTPITPKLVTKLALHQPTYRILVVDDTEANTQLMVSWLTAAGFEVKTADNGQRAIALWEAYRPDLIWMDMRMPVMDGLEATRQIRARESDRLPPTKIIAITATVFEEEQQQIMAAGCDDFVGKPCSEAVFLETIRHHLHVQYIYEASNTYRSLIGAGSDSSALLEALQKLQAPQTMPSEWVNQLNLAARSADERAIAQLLEALPEEHHGLKEAIIKMVSEFQLEHLINLTQPQ